MSSRETLQPCRHFGSNEMTTTATELWSNINSGKGSMAIELARLRETAFRAMRVIGSAA